MGACNEEVCGLRSFIDRTTDVDALSCLCLSFGPVQVDRCVIDRVTTKDNKCLDITLIQASCGNCDALLCSGHFDVVDRSRKCFVNRNDDRMDRLWKMLTSDDDRVAGMINQVRRASVDPLSVDHKRSTDLGQFSSQRTTNMLLVQNCRTDLSDKCAHLARAETETVIGHRASRRQRALDRVKPAHLARILRSLDLTSLGEVACLAQRTVSVDEELRVECEHSLRLSKFWKCAQ